MDSLQTNTTPIAQALCVDGKKLWRWYKDTLSGFTDAQQQLRHHQFDFAYKEKGEIRQVRVPILKPEHIGENMAIDEKQIGEDMHTILSNRDTGKIALLAKTLKTKELSMLIPHFEQCGFKVRTLTRDLSPGYDWFSRQAFLNAAHVADKFHIVSSVLEAMQSVRIRYRQDLLRERRTAFENHKHNEKLRQQQCKKEGVVFKKKKFEYKEKRLSNGETPLELLARSRYLLYKYPGDFTPSQKERAEVLFKLYPEIKNAYKLSCSFRIWYRKENVGKDIKLLETQLQGWFEETEKLEIDEMLSFKTMVETHKTVIMRYFISGHTNAIAENINSKIQRFVMINQGTRNREFFYFRLAKYFS